jgi:hypothetical protein
MRVRAQGRKSNGVVTFLSRGASVCALCRRRSIWHHVLPQGGDVFTHDGYSDGDAHPPNQSMKPGATRFLRILADADDPCRIAPTRASHMPALFWAPCTTIYQLPRETETTITDAFDILSECAGNDSNPHNTPETQAHPTRTTPIPSPKPDNSAPAAQHGVKALATETTKSSPNNLRIVPTSSNPTWFAYHVSRFRKIRLLTQENLE